MPSKSASANFKEACLAAAPNGLLIGTAQAHLLRFLGDTLEPVESFDTVEGREEWHTPWGDPAAVG